MNTRPLFALLSLLLLHIVPAAAQGLTKVNLVLNFAADGGATGFYHALERGYFRELGLDVAIEPSKGSADAITSPALTPAALSCANSARNCATRCRSPSRSTR